MTEAIAENILSNTCRRYQKKQYQYDKRVNYIIQLVQGYAGPRLRMTRRRRMLRTRFHYGDRASGRFVARDELSALSAVRSLRDVRLHAPTWVVIFFHPPPYDWRYRYLFFSFHFFVFPFTFHKCCYFFSFPVFSFTFYMSEVFLTTFIWKLY